MLCLAAEANKGRGSNSESLFDRVSTLAPGFDPHTAIRMTAEHTGLLVQSEDSQWGFRDRIYQDFFSAVSWVSALSDKVTSFADEFRKPYKSGSTFAKFVGYSSSDASETLEQLLRSATPDQIDMVIHFAEVLSQRIAVPSSTLTGYANLAIEALRLQILDRLDPISVEEDGTTTLSLRMMGDHFTSDKIIGLIAALYRARDGVGGEAIKAALKNQKDQAFRALDSFFAAEGELSVLKTETSINCTLREVLPTVERGPS